MNRRNQNETNENVRAQNLGNQGAEEGVKLNGLQQVVDMLKYADPSFRESLLRRIAQRDPELASKLKKTIR